jgi:MFS family permease
VTSGGLAGTVALLATAQALFQSMQSMAITTTPLAGHAMLGVDKSLATVPIFFQHVGVMLATIPASLLMARVGRRRGFSVGALIGCASGLVSFAAVFQQSFWLLCLGALLSGHAVAFAWYFRFAAVDAAQPHERARAISLVMAGGVVAGLIGPQVAKSAVGLFSPVIFAGVYLMVAIFALLALAVVQFLRIPDLTPAERAEVQRPMIEIARQPTYLVALLSSMLGFAVMTLVMTSTPIAMLDCGFLFNDSATVIQAHIVAMFLPSFFTGHLITRFGVLPIIAVGALIEIGCVIVNAMGVGFANFMIANILVGLGWNFCYVGGTALLTEAYRPAERARAQAVHDFAVYTATATAAGASSWLYTKAGWLSVNLAMLPVLASMLVALAWLAHRRRMA